MGAGSSVFRDRLLRLTDAQKLFRVFPFIPVDFELVYSVFAVLHRAPSWPEVAGTKPYTVRQGGRGAAR